YLRTRSSDLALQQITAPVASTTWPVGSPVTVQWQDDGSTPLLSSIGVCQLGIFTGNQIQQTELQQVGTLDVSVNNSITFQINTNIGPSNQQVFMRFTSQSLMDPTTPQYPYEAFSAMFSLTGANGIFNSTIQAQIDGASTAGAIGGASTSAPASSSTPKASTSAAASSA
ncbi:hypothetical protein K488DRAFT_16760, partial [Vararia minispora EC-137]